MARKRREISNRMLLVWLIVEEIVDRMLRRDPLIPIRHPLKNL